MFMSFDCGHHRPSKKKNKEKPRKKRYNIWVMHPSHQPKKYSPAGVPVWLLQQQQEVAVTSLAKQVMACNRRRDT